LQAAAREESTVPGVKEILVLDAANIKLTSIIGAPAYDHPEIQWMLDNHTFIARSFLPIHDHESEAAEDVPVEIQVPQRKIIRLTETAWKSAIATPKTEDLRVTLEENVNTPPKIYVESISQNRKTLLLDLNPQFNELEFGKVEELELSIDGVHVVAGVYYPPNTSPSVRYPLVIQTHGFDPRRFSMDGQDEWSSGYAARPLAAKGFVVLQIFSFKTAEDAEKYLQDPTLGRTPEERAKVLYLRVCEAAIDTLDQRGLIDRKRIGISGFSVTVMFVGYILTHSTYSFAAGILTDGVDGNYGQYLDSRIRVFEQYNGGDSPFTSNGLKFWLAGSPSFRLGTVRTPMRLVALKQEDILEMWEWFSALRMQEKPVELIKLPEASHLLQRPADRKVAMEGIVDWFRFWLQQYEYPQPAKRSQYARWESLRKMEDAASTGQ
jgi:dipeptidyl aminopeptidase/acylaminoacyl peptidase